MNKATFRLWADNKAGNDGSYTTYVAKQMKTTAEEVKVFDVQAGTIAEAISGKYEEIGKLESELSAYVKTRLGK